MATVQFSVFATCAFFLSCTFALDPHQLELKQHYEHLAYIADFPCLHPQPRVIAVGKLFSEGQSHGKAYFPDVTVLHRCDECTGSCTSGHSCAAKVTELVLLPFKATYLYDTEKHKQGAWQMEYHELLNHTECACAVPPPKDSCHSNNVDSTLQKREPQESGSMLGVRIEEDSSSPPALSSSSLVPEDDLFVPSSPSSTTDLNVESTTKDYLSELFERAGANKS